MVTPLKRPKRTTLQDLEAQRDEACTRLELAEARQEALACALSALVKHLRKVDGYMTHDVQGHLRHAEALLVDRGA